MDRDRQPDPNLASELRSGAGHEFLTEAAEDERLTELQRKRRLTLADRAREMANRGDRVSIEFGGHSFSGSVQTAGHDYLTIIGPGQDADIRLDTARWSILPVDSPGETQEPRAETFLAVLQEHAAAATTVRLSLPNGDIVIGTLTVVTPDHVEVADVDQRLLVVPMNLILGVVRSSEH